MGFFFSHQRRARRKDKNQWVCLCVHVYLTDICPCYTSSKKAVPTLLDHREGMIQSQCTAKRRKASLHCGCVQHAVSVEEATISYYSSVSHSCKAVMQSDSTHWELLHAVLALTEEVSVVKKEDKHIGSGPLSSFIWWLDGELQAHLFHCVNFLRYSPFVCYCFFTSICVSIGKEFCGELCACPTSVQAWHVYIYKELWTNYRRPKKLRNSLEKLVKFLINGHVAEGVKSVA